MLPLDRNVAMSTWDRNVTMGTWDRNVAMLIGMLP